MSAIQSTDKMAMVALASAMTGILVYPIIFIFGANSPAVIGHNAPLIQLAGSLILLLALGAGLLMPVSFVCGFIALRRIRRSDMPLKGRSLSWLAITLSGGYILFHTFLS